MITSVFTFNYEEYQALKKNRGWRTLKPPTVPVRMSRNFGIVCCFIGLLIGSCLYLAIMEHWRWALWLPVIYFFFLRGIIPLSKKGWRRFEEEFARVTFTADEQIARYEKGHKWIQFCWHKALVLESSSMIVFQVNGESFPLPKRSLSPDDLAQVREWIARNPSEAEESKT